jgi:ribonuclease P protein component
VATTFRPDEHIRRRADFEAAYEAGVKINSRWMTVFVRPNSTGRARLGIAATRKIGGAVIRNRAKRVTRELFRTHKPLVAVDIVIVPRREFVDAPFATLEREFESLLSRATRAKPNDAAHASGRSRRARGAGVHSRV